MGGPHTVCAVRTSEAAFYMQAQEMLANTLLMSVGRSEDALVSPLEAEASTAGPLPELATSSEQVSQHGQGGSPQDAGPVPSPTSERKAPVPSDMADAGPIEKTPACLPSPSDSLLSQTIPLPARQPHLHHLQELLNQRMQLLPRRHLPALSLLMSLLLSLLLTLLPSWVFPLSVRQRPCRHPGPLPPA